VGKPVITVSKGNPAPAPVEVKKKSREIDISFGGPIKINKPKEKDIKILEITINKGKKEEPTKEEPKKEEPKKEEPKEEPKKEEPKEEPKKEEPKKDDVNAKPVVVITKTKVPLYSISKGTSYPAPKEEPKKEEPKKEEPKTEEPKKEEPKKEEDKKEEVESKPLIVITKTKVPLYSISKGRKMLL
jgi:hypothetical protein